MAPQFTIWCPPSVRDDFDDYCDQVAKPADWQRVVEAFESFHQLLAGGSGSLPPIRYSGAPPVPSGAIDVEVRINQVRFYVQVDFTDQFIWLNGITDEK